MLTHFIHVLGLRFELLFNYTATTGLVAYSRLGKDNMLRLLQHGELGWTADTDAFYYDKPYQPTPEEALRPLIKLIWEVEDAYLDRRKASNEEFLGKREGEGT